MAGVPNQSRTNTYGTGGITLWARDLGSESRPALKPSFSEVYEFQSAETVAACHVGSTNHTAACQETGETHQPRQEMRRLRYEAANFVTLMAAEERRINVVLLLPWERRKNTP